MNQIKHAVKIAKVKYPKGNGEWCGCLTTTAAMQLCMKMLSMHWRWMWTLVASGKQWEMVGGKESLKKMNYSLGIQKACKWLLKKVASTLAEWMLNRWEFLQVISTSRTRSQQLSVSSWKKGYVHAAKILLWTEPNWEGMAVTPFPFLLFVFVYCCRSILGTSLTNIFVG